MYTLKEHAAPESHPPRLISRHRTNHNIDAPVLNQSSSGKAQMTNSQKGDKMNQVSTNSKEDYAVIEQVVMQGDLSKLNPEQRVSYYNKVCQSLGLNPFTKPFDYINLNGKLTLYAKKDCTEQLRKLNGVSIEELNDVLMEDTYIVTAKARDKTGRIDQAKGAVVIGHLKGDNKANAIMKAETKAKRRVTLSICGLGWTDEMEIDSIPNAKTVEVDMETGEIKDNIQTKATNLTGDTSPPSPKTPKTLIDSPLPRIQVLITPEQIAELEMILSECDEDYQDDVNKTIKKYFGQDLSFVPAEMFDRIKTAAVNNMEKNHKKQRAESVENMSEEAK